MSYFPGATTIGLVCSDGVILASEKRVAYGNIVLSKTAKKVFKITDRVGAACAGLISDMQVLTKQIAAHAKIFKFDTGKPMLVRAVAKATANVLFGRRFSPYITQTIVGGIDDEPKIYVLDPVGSLIEDKYAAIGSGAEIAIGILESEYKPDITVKEGEELAVKTLKSAISRDVFSGNGIDILIVDRKGIEEKTLKLE
ncbi:archaeal proteasome endopeptidase complex subunit beta [Candidatus Bathyarchaeota archaeon]|nr:archaeal proteasome endopeptidase complex subunit beta [Candidatus Bathyarchaeota archaeon]